MKRPLAGNLARLALAAAAVWPALMAALWWGQERLIFHPIALPPTHRFDFGADVHEAWVEVPGARLHALHLRLPRPRGIVFYLHGNAGNLASWFHDADLYRRLNLDLYMLDYRGYGKSSGRIDGLAQLEADVRAAWASIAPAYAGRQRIFIGRSLGSGLAAGLAAVEQPELTVLLSPYTSLAALAREHYPWVPAALLRYPIATEAALPALRGRVLLIHGARDKLIAPEHGRRLQQLAPQAELVIVPGAGHDDLHLSPLYREALRNALTR